VGQVVLDTGVLVALERGQLAARDLVDEQEDLAVPAVVVAEFLVGVYLAANDRQRVRRQEFLDGPLAAVPVVDYTTAVAECHAELLVHARSAGLPRGAHNLIVAATALATNSTVLTTDVKARFDELPGVSARIV
jgi:tRNA(fMet)-specific endonuclease VapC